MECVNNYEDISLNDEVIRKVENDLRCYPDWIVRLEADGLGLPARHFPTGGCGYSFSSMVESAAELENDIEKKVYIIEKIYDRLRGKTRDIVEKKYFRDYGRQEVLSDLNLSKKQYYNLRNRALESFARALSYID